MQDSHSPTMDEAHPVAQEPNTGTGTDDAESWEGIYEFETNIVVIAHIEDPTTESSPARNARFLVVPPRVEAFDALAETGYVIVSLSVVVALGDEPETTYWDWITKVESWSVKTPKQRPLIQLHTRRGQIFEIQDDRVSDVHVERLLWAERGSLKSMLDRSDVINA